MRVRSHLNIVKISKGNGNKILAATVTYLQFLQQILKKNAHLNSANTCDTLEKIVVLKNTVVNKVFYRDDRDGNVPWKRNIVFCGAAT